MKFIIGIIILNLLFGNYSVGDTISIEFDRSCFGIAPGQSVVFYSGEICLGGAVIDSYWN